MKNPTWKREDLILALDRYFRLEYGQMDEKKSKAQELSRLLTQLNEEGHEIIVNSIQLKLVNFKRFNRQYAS